MARHLRRWTDTTSWWYSIDSRACSAKTHCCATTSSSHHTQPRNIIRGSKVKQLKRWKERFELLIPLSIAQRVWLVDERRTSFRSLIFHVDREQACQHDGGFILTGGTLVHLHTITSFQGGVSAKQIYGVFLEIQFTIRFSDRSVFMVKVLMKIRFA